MINLRVNTDHGAVPHVTFSGTSYEIGKQQGGTCQNNNIQNSGKDLPQLL